MMKTVWWLQDVDTGKRLREATEDEVKASEEAAERDGGVGVIEIDGRKVYTQTGSAHWRPLR